MKEPIAIQCGAERAPGPGLVPANGGAWLDRGIVVAVVLACGVALSLNVADPDLWGHVQYGRDALVHGLPRVTTYSYVAEGYPWINHEILAEYVLAIGNDWFGGSGLLVGKCLLGLAVVGAMIRRSFSQGAGLIAACGLALIVAVTLGNHWSLRPQLASYVSFTLLLALLSYCFHGWEGKGFWRFWRNESLSPSPPLAPRGRGSDQLEYSVSRLKYLWLVTPLFVLWTNAHGGFLAGLCVLIAYLGLRGIEAVMQKGRAADGLLLRFGLMGAAAALATFINPYGPLFHAWLWDDLKVPRPEIVEWRAPELWDVQFLPFWILAGVASASLAFSKRERDWTQITILGLILWQALTHHRHIAFFAIACGWWLPGHLDSILKRIGIGATEDGATAGRRSGATGFSGGLSPTLRPVFGVLLAIAICICGGRLVSRVSALNVERDVYPVDAFEYIARQGLTGKMVCQFNWAQYALAAFGPREAGQPGILVQIDGRCRTSYSQAMLDMHFDFLLGPPNEKLRYRDPKSGPYDPVRVLNFERPDLVLLSRLQGPSVQAMQKQSDRWVLLYQDGMAQVWGRASRYDDAQSANYLPPEEREIGERMPEGIALWPALPPYQPSAAERVAVK